MYCKLYSLYGIIYDLQSLCKTISNLCVGYIVVCNCVQVVYKNVKYKHRIIKMLK